MGWEAYYKDGSVVKEEDGAGRPVNDGEEGLLAIIAQRDFGHSVAVDLINGVIFLDFEQVTWQGSWYLENFRSYFWIAEETNVIGQMEFVRRLTEPDEEGWFTQESYHATWRPIWFTRFTNGDPTKVIGCQTTLPEEQGGHNIKKLICLFSDGRIGVD